MIETNERTNVERVDFLQKFLSARPKKWEKLALLFSKYRKAYYALDAFMPLDSISLLYA